MMKILVVLEAAKLSSNYIHWGSKMRKEKMNRVKFGLTEVSAHNMPPDIIIQ